MKGFRYHNNKGIVISIVSGVKRALVQGKGWTPLTQINPNDFIMSHQKEKVVWLKIKWIKKPNPRTEQYKLLAAGYVDDLYTI